MKRRGSPADYLRYKEQQDFLDVLALKYGVVAFRPEYHGAMGDKNTVLFYLKEDEAHNRRVDRQPTSYSRGEAEDLVRTRYIAISPDCIYKDPFWVFENSDVNGLGDFDFANRGKVDLRGVDWKQRVEGHFSIALIKKLRREHVRESGGWFTLREADDELNDFNRELIGAYKTAYGKAFLGSINYYDKRRELIASGKESVYEEYTTGQMVYTATADFVVPKKDEALEEKIREWNREPVQNAAKLIDEITNLIERVGGEHLIWT